MSSVENQTGRNAAKGAGNHGEARTAEVVSTKLKALGGMTYDALRREWRQLYRAHPPKRVARNLLMLGVAWKIQEQAYGGLNAAIKRRLAGLAKNMEQDGDIVRSRIERLRPNVPVGSSA